MPVIIVSACLLIVPGIMIFAARVQNQEMRRKFETVGRAQRLPLDAVETIWKVDEHFMAHRGPEALATLEPLLRSRNDHIRERAYRELATLWSEPSIRAQIHARLEETRTDRSAEVRAQYPLYLVLSAAPNALERAEQLASNGDEATRKVATEAVAWAKQHGVGAG